MNQQYPPQQPQPGWGPQQPGWGAPPQPPKKRSAGKIVGFGCLGIVALFVLIGIIAAIAGGGSKSSGSGGVKPAPAASTSTSSTPAGGKAKTTATPKQTDKPASKPAKKTVTFKVWGTAPAGALGPLDITYGSDSDTRKGTWKNGSFEATLPLNKDAMYYDVSAQLQGSGDIHCSVTVDGHTKKGHASGGYNICSAQLSSGLLGGWD